MGFEPVMLSDYPDGPTGWGFKFEVVIAVWPFATQFLRVGRFPPLVSFR